MKSLPNILTFSRIGAIPVIIALFFLSEMGNSALFSWILLAVYAAAGITDYFDGVLARKLEVTSSIGRMFDPIADKMLVLTLLFMLVWAERLNDWHVIAGIIILLREVLVAGLREYLAGDKLSLPVTKLAKWKTTAQMTALGFLIMADHAPDMIPAYWIGVVLLWIAAVMTAITGGQYLKAAIAALADED